MGEQHELSKALGIGALPKHLDGRAVRARRVLPRLGSALGCRQLRQDFLADLFEYV